MPDWIVVIILGIVEGITEFIPVSSTGHLLIAEKLLHVAKSDLFNVVIQCGAVIAVLPLFPQRLYKFVFELRDKETQSYLLKIFTAFVITCIGGFIIDKKGIKLPEALAPVAWALLIGGLVFLAVEFFLRGKKLGNEVTWAIAIAVGVGQLVAAVFPGASRSGTTIMICLLLGSRPPGIHGIFVPRRHSNNAGGWWLEDSGRVPSSGSRRTQGRLGNAGAGNHRGRRGFLHRREMVAALCANAHVHRVWLVSDCAGGGDFYLLGALKITSRSGPE
ncbi:MAG: undecaprenyl-diphosphate phosphatase [Limisphaerales bacterium]